MTKGKLKHDHRGLIYSGGLLVAIAQDQQIRAATGNDRRLDDLMRYMFDEYRGNTHQLDDIEQALGDLNDASQKDFFDRHVRGIDRLDISQFLLLARIETTEEDSRVVFRIREDAHPFAAEIRRGLFGERH